MHRNNKTVLEILALLQVGDTVMVTGKLISGDVYDTENNILNFSCLETKGRWKLSALGLRTSKEMEDNVRLIGFEHIEGNKDIEVGFSLISEGTHEPEIG